ncbi:hypothetical protein BaRGS_00006233 [Batillaria attramentaria]|uniref:Uncharacterized protein n=1 Tax=Batillaria attramentaria TaxID=370345 RepID=A0ABD0LT27_9CAEN
MFVPIMLRQRESFSYVLPGNERSQSGSAGAAEHCNQTTQSYKHNTSVVLCPTTVVPLKENLPLQSDIKPVSKWQTRPLSVGKTEGVVFEVDWGGYSRQMR